MDHGSRMRGCNWLDRWCNMWWTWLIAATLWMEREDVLDPFRMAEEMMADILPIPKPLEMPKEPTALVA